MIKRFFKVCPLKLGALAFLAFLWFIFKDFKDSRHPINLVEIFLVTGGAAFFGLVVASFATNVIRAFEGGDVVWSGSGSDEDGHRFMQDDNGWMHHNIDGTPMIGGMGGIDMNGNTYGNTSNDD